MSRSGYTDDADHLELYRATVHRALHGARGQHFLRKLRTALDALPVKRLIANELSKNGEVCALGAVDPNMTLDPEDTEAVAKHYSIAHSMAAEIVYLNDEWPVRAETPEERWTRMRAWVEGEIVPYDDEVSPLPAAPVPPPSKE